MSSNECQIYCTVFDKNYLYQGVSLYRSMERVIPDFKLYCLVLDDESVNALKQLNFPKIKVVSIGELNPTHVDFLKSKLSYQQFCWSMQPLACGYVLNQNEPHVTYLEADSWFFSNPLPVLNEIGDGAVTLSPHFFSPQYQYLEVASGKYCTQFNFFRNDERGKACLEYWREQNFEYRRELPFVVPGQRALNSFESKFKGVVVIKNRGLGVAPWNIQQYKVSKENGKTLIDGQPVIFYHYHQLARYQDGRFDLGDYPLTSDAIQHIYEPYIQEVLDTEKLVRAKVPSFNFKKEVQILPNLFTILFTFNKTNLKKYIHRVIKKIKGNENIVKPMELSTKL